MSGSKEAELLAAVFLYATRCLAEGDQQALRGMNFGPKEIAALRELGLEDLYQAGVVQVHCVDIRLNRRAYWPLIAHLRRTREAETVKRELMRLDAPLEMMQSLFRLTPREYTRLRRLLVPEPAIGRPPEADEATSQALWRAWSRRIREASSGRLEPQAYLELQQETGAPLRTVWALTERWSVYGNLCDEAGEAKPLEPAQAQGSEGAQARASDATNA